MHDIRRHGVIVLVKMLAATLLLLFLCLIATVMQEALGAAGALGAIVAVGVIVIVLLLAYGISTAK